MAQVIPMLFASAGAASAGSTALSVLSAGASIFGALSGMAAGDQEARSLELDAAASDIEATQEHLAGRKQALDLREELDRTIGSQNVAYAASGIGLSAGTPVEAAKRARVHADRQVSTVRTDAEVRAASRRVRSRRLIVEAENTRAKSRANAIGSLAKAGIGILNRG